MSTWQRQFRHACSVCVSAVYMIVIMIALTNGMWPVLFIIERWEQSATGQWMRLMYGLINGCYFVFTACTVLYVSIVMQGRVVKDIEGSVASRRDVVP